MIWRIDNYSDATILKQSIFHVFDTLKIKIIFLAY